MAKEKVALFVDYENIFLSIENEYRRSPAPDLIVKGINDKVKEFGIISKSYAYADWEKFPGAPGVLKEHGVEPKYPITKTKGNAADQLLIADVMDIYYTCEEIKIFVIVAGDKDYLEVIHRMRQKGKEIKVLSMKRTTGKVLKEEMGTDIIFLDEILEITPAPADITISSQDIEQLIMLVKSIEDAVPFVGLKYLRNKILTPGICKGNPEKAVNLINQAIGNEILLTYKAENPKKPDFPVTACKLNKSHELVKKVLSP